MVPLCIAILCVRLCMAMVPLRMQWCLCVPLRAMVPLPLRASPLCNSAFVCLCTCNGASVHNNPLRASVRAWFCWGCSNTNVPSLKPACCLILCMAILCVPVCVLVFAGDVATRTFRL